MKTGIDTNVISAIWSREAGWEAAMDALRVAREAGGLVLSGVAFAELLAYPGATERMLDGFVVDFEIDVDFGTTEELWREAGRRFSLYSRRRRAARPGDVPKRLPADFVIGAHALLRADRLVTLDNGRYVRDFPELTLLAIKP